MTFSEWLQQQDEREDSIGELARQVLPDTICPIWSNRLSTYRSFLIYRDASREMINALEEAFLEWIEDKIELVSIRL